MPPSPFDPRSGFAEHAMLAGLRLSGFASWRVPTSAGRVHVLEGKGYGPLPPVALLHGFSSAGVHYQGLLRRLRPHVRWLLAPDSPAHGFSDDPPRVTPDVLERGLFEALDRALPPEKAVLYGNSMGGLAAARYALRRPEKVRALILCSPLGAPMTEAELDEFRVPFRVNGHQQALSFVDRVFTMRGPMRHLIAWGVRRKFQSGMLTSLLEAVRPSDLLTSEELKQIAVPTLFVWGGAERVLPSAHRDFFVENLPAGAIIEQPPTFGHSPYLIDPQAAALQILGFLRGLERGRAAA